MGKKRNFNPFRGLDRSFSCTFDRNLEGEIFSARISKNIFNIMGFYLIQIYE